jgi:hypothetical protein
MQYGHPQLWRSKMEVVGVLDLVQTKGVSQTLPESCGLCYAEVAAVDAGSYAGE